MPNSFSEVEFPDPLFVTRDVRPNRLAAAEEYSSSRIRFVADWRSFQQRKFRERVVNQD